MTPANLPTARVRGPRHVMGITEIALFLNVKRSNVRKMLAHYNVEPLDELVRGPVYSVASIKDLKRRRDADERARAADEKRRAAAQARRR